MSTAHARNTDPSTSHSAAASIGDTTPLQRRLLVLFDMDHDGLNDEQLIKLYKTAFGTAFPSTESSIRSRRSDLVVKGHLVDSGKFRPTLHGNKSIVWISAGRLW